MIPLKTTIEQHSGRGKGIQKKWPSRFSQAIRHRFRPNRLAEADGLRGVAMIFVFLYHFRSAWLGSVRPGSLEHGFLQLVYVNGGIGTDFFLLLSGFFCYRTWGSSTSGYVAFLKRRLCRIYPLFLLVSLLYVTVSVFYPEMSHLPSSAEAATVYVLQTLLFLPGILPIRPLMEVAWTMSWIVLFYFLTPLISQSLVRLGWSSGQKTLALAMAALLWMAVAQATGWPPRTAMLLFGLSLSEAFPKHAGAGARPLGGAATFACLGLSMAAVAVRSLVLLNPDIADRGSTDILVTLTTAVAVGAFVWSVLRGSTGLRRLFRWTPLVWFGMVSYSFYLTHGLAIKLMRVAILPAPGYVQVPALLFWLFQALTLALAVALASAVYLLIENPIAARLSRVGASGGIPIFQPLRLTGRAGAGATTS
jgi:exopolysaccharide production protein ExoZ